MTTIQIQKATPDHADQILAVLVAAFEQYRDTLDPPSGVFRETADNIRHKLEEGGGFIATDAERIVGAVLYQPHPDYMYLGRLAVLPEYRGHQIASRLTGSVEQAARDHQLNRVQLGVRIVLKQNQQLFQRLGYAIIAHKSHENYSEYTYLVMEKSLA